ncbi:hypothetical protein NHQ30_011384 [Ciborinia camelliae]|nr:hypothetical protein NHQ30_011384 [Ciborinia camelliae]
MVKFTSIALFLIASAVSVQAGCNYCECQYRGGQPCCVTPPQDSAVVIDCHEVCLQARKIDGTATIVNGVYLEGSFCNGGGNNKCINKAQMLASPTKCATPTNTGSPIGQ